MAEIVEFVRETLGDMDVRWAEPLLESPGCQHLYTARTGGVSQGEFESLNFRRTGDKPENILENCRRAAALAGCDVQDIVRTRQEHTDLIDVVRQWAPGIRVGFDNKQPSDGLITNVPGVCLMGFYADCQLLLFYDRRNHAAGCVHSGWRGTALAIAEKTIAMMGREYGTRPEDLVCSIGPSICQSCFETDRDVYDRLTERFGPEAERFCQTKGDKFYWDTKGLNLWRLRSAGVPRDQIAVSDECTCCGDPALWWSHRRQGDRRGVHAGLIALDR